MSKVAVVFWSGTGNTEEMAKYVSEGATAAGASVETISISDFSVDSLSEFDAFAFGCPAMGAEVLEEAEFQPVWDDIEGSLSGKKIALFGSYDWGDGEWMRDWESNAKSKGAILAHDSVICQLEPDEDAQEACKSLGKSLA